MMQQPIVTSRLLMDLADVAQREGLATLDPWGPPPLCPFGAHDVVTLGLDGSIRRVPIDDAEWRDVVAFRFESQFGELLKPPRRRGYF